MIPVTGVSLLNRNTDDDDDEIDEDDDLIAKSIKPAPPKWRFWLFFSSPQVIFTTHTISFFIFLDLFGYVLLFDYNQRPSGKSYEQQQL